MNSPQSLEGAIKLASPVRNCVGVVTEKKIEIERE